MEENETRKLSWSEAFKYMCKKIAEREELTEKETDDISEAFSIVKEKFKELSEEDIETEIDKIEPVDKKSLKEKLSELGITIKDKCSNVKESVINKKDEIKHNREEKKKEKELQELERLEEKYRK